MSSFNQFTIIGRLTRDPEVNPTPSGDLLAKFTVAVDQPFKNKQTGEKETDFFSVSCWRKTAEFVSLYVTKGRLVVVTGRVKTRKYRHEKDSVEAPLRMAFEISAEKVETLDRKPDAVEAGVPAGIPARSDVPDPYADDEEDNFATDPRMEAAAV